jgi:hypothetical protein
MATLKDDTKLEVLHDHYKETFSHIEDFRKLRDQLLALIFITITLMLFQVFSPMEAGNAIGQFVVNSLDIQGSIDISFLGSVIWFSLLAFVVRYFQTVVHIERQYDYVHSLEELLSQYYDGNAFTREGKSYLRGYPLFSNWASALYTIIFPGLMFIIVVAKIGNEFYLANHIPVLLVFNSLIALFILVSIVLYLILLFFRK